MFPFASTLQPSCLSQNRRPRLHGADQSDALGLRSLIASLLLVLGGAIGTLSAAAEELPTLPLTVNVNAADARTIANVLQGVGLSRATAIVAYREANGSFKSIDALTAVKGVGDRTVELNATRILLAD